MEQALYEWAGKISIDLDLRRHAVKLWPDQNVAMVVFENALQADLFWTGTQWVDGMTLQPETKLRRIA